MKKHLNGLSYIEISVISFFAVLLIALVLLGDSKKKDSIKDIKIIDKTLGQDFIKITDSNGNKYQIIRVRTPEGWLLYDSYYHRMTFVPDSGHKWKKEVK